MLDWEKKHATLGIEQEWIEEAEAVGTFLSFSFPDEQIWSIKFLPVNDSGVAVRVIFFNQFYAEAGLRFKSCDHFICYHNINIT